MWARICTLHTDFILHDSEFSRPLRLVLLFRCVVSTLACPPTVCRILMDLFTSTYSATTYQKPLIIRLNSRSLYTPQAVSKGRLFAGKDLHLTYALRLAIIKPLSALLNSSVVYLFRHRIMVWSAFTIIFAIFVSLLMP